MKRINSTEVQTILERYWDEKIGAIVTVYAPVLPVEEYICHIRGQGQYTVGLTANGATVEGAATRAYIPHGRY